MSELTKVCEHGSLERKCDVCNYRKELADATATIARLEAEVEKNKDRSQWYDRTIADLAKMCGKAEATTHGLDYTTIIGAKLAKLEAENAGLRERAEGLARECQAWRECDIARANDDSGIEPSGLSEASYSLSRIMAKTDAAGWLRGATDGR